MKCGHTEIEEGTLSATGSGLSKMFDVQHNNFKTITCTNWLYRVLQRKCEPCSDFIDLFFGDNHFESKSHALLIKIHFYQISLNRFVSFIVKISKLNKHK